MRRLRGVGYAGSVFVDLIASVVHARRRSRGSRGCAREVGLEVSWLGWFVLPGLESEVGQYWEMME